MTAKHTLYSFVGILVAAHNVGAFLPSSTATRCGTPLFSEPEKIGRLERIEYKIYPDGRVEEKVLGVKGESCLEITREINEKLGEVISTTPTEEMFEEEIKLDQTLSNTDGGDGASWEGSTSW